MVRLTPKAAQRVKPEVEGSWRRSRAVAPASHLACQRAAADWTNAVGSLEPKLRPGRSSVLSADHVSAVGAGPASPRSVRLCLRPGQSPQLASSLIAAPSRALVVAIAQACSRLTPERESCRRTGSCRPVGHAEVAARPTAHSDQVDVWHDPMRCIRDTSRRVLGPGERTQAPVLYEAESALFNAHAIAWSSNTPRANLEGSESVLRYDSPSNSPRDVRLLVDQLLTETEQHIGCAALNDQQAQRRLSEPCYTIPLQSRWLSLLSTGAANRRFGQAGCQPLK